MTRQVAAVGSLNAEQVGTVLAAAGAAPSPHNSRPWRFRCTSAGIELRADPGRALPVADPQHRELRVACGAALCNLRLAMRTLGCYPQVRPFPAIGDPNLLAVVRPDGRHTPTSTDRELAGAIGRRRTDPRPFRRQPVTPALRMALRRAATTEQSWLAELNPDQLPVLRRLAWRAYRAQLADPHLLAERAHWTGRPATAGGLPAPEPQHELLPHPVRPGAGEPEPLVVVIGSVQDDAAGQLQAGQAMQRVLLTAAAAGPAAAFLSQVVQVPDTRGELRELLGGGLWPQAVLRIGYADPPAGLPPRPVDEAAECGGADGSSGGC